MSVRHIDNVRQIAEIFRASGQLKPVCGRVSRVRFKPTNFLMRLMIIRVRNGEQYLLWRDSMVTVQGTGRLSTCTMGRNVLG